MTVPLSDARLDLHRRLSALSRKPYGDMETALAELLAEVDRLRAELVSTRCELSDVKLRRDDARAGRQDAENEVERLRAELAAIRLAQVPKVCVCGHSELSHTVPEPHSCFAQAQQCPCEEYQDTAGRPHFAAAPSV